MLHQEGCLRVSDRGNNGLLGRHPLRKPPVQRADQVKRPALFTLEHGRIDVGNRLLVRDVEDGSLGSGRQKGITEDTHSSMGNGGLVRAKDNIPGEVRILCAASISHPRPGAGVTQEWEASVHEEISLGVLTELGCH